MIAYRAVMILGGVDPSESRNLADSRPDIVAKLKVKLTAWVEELPKVYAKDAAKKNKK